MRWHCLPRGGGAAACLTRARGRVSKSLTEAQSKDWVQESGLPLAGQAMEPFTMAMVAVWLCKRVSRQVSEPLVPKSVFELSS